MQIRLDERGIGVDDGRTVGDIVAGDGYDGAIAISVERVAYTGGATFDVLPAGATGMYWANGVLLASTLRLVVSTAPADR